jgi:hypothetical protein
MSFNSIYYYVLLHQESMQFKETLPENGINGRQKMKKNDLTSSTFSEMFNSVSRFFRVLSLLGFTAKRK